MCMCIVSEFKLIDELCWKSLNMCDNVFFEKLKKLSNTNCDCV